MYTTFYSFIYDFDYIGFIPLIAIIALYYVFTYQRIKGGKISSFSLLLFIYTYLFNDLIMLAFSNRFYSTVLDIGFIKIVIFSLICRVLFLRKVG